MSVRTIPAAALGPQLHIGRRPQAPLSWAADIRNQAGDCPHGGLWTSSIDRSGKVRYLDYSHVNHPLSVAGNDTWLLLPRGDLPVLHIDSRADVEWVFKTFRTPYQWLDVEAVRAAGYTGMHVTDDAIRNSIAYGEPLNRWHSESTVWFAWAFEREAQPFSPLDRESPELPRLQVPITGLSIRDPAFVVFDPYWLLRLDKAEVRRWFSGPTLLDTRTTLDLERYCADVLAAMLLGWDLPVELNAEAIRHALTPLDQYLIYYLVIRALNLPTVRIYRSRDGEGLVIET